MISRHTAPWARTKTLALAASALALAAVFGPPSRAADDLSNWQPVKIGAGGFVTGFVTHPKDANVRYCRTDVGNAYRWDSGSNQWIPMLVHNQSGSAGMPASAAPAPGEAGCESLAVDPNNTSVVYLAFRNGFSSDFASQYSSVKGSVYKSTDGGRSFSASDLSVDMSPNSNWRSLGERMAVDPQNSSVIYYGTNSSGLWRSTNGGANWSQVTGGGAPDSSKVIVGVRFDPTSSHAVYAITLDGGVYRSGDNGANWSDVANGTNLEGHTANSTISPDGSLWVVQDGSTTVWHYAGGGWSTTNVDFGWGQGVEGVTVDPNNTNRLWAIGGGGALSRTDNGGGSWNPAYHDLQFANTLGWMPQTTGGAWRSNGGIFYDRNGALWIPEGNEGILTYTPTNSEGNSAAAAPHWTIQSQGIEEFVTHDVSLPPGGKALFAVEDATGFVSSDLSAFSAVQIPLQNQLISNGTSITYCPNAPSYLAVATADVNGTGSGSNYSGYSTDGGTTWHPFGSYPVSASGNTIRQAGTLAISRRNGWGDGGDHLVWLPTGGVVPFYSTDGGASWHQNTTFAADSNSSFSGLTGYWIFSLKQRQLVADPFVADKFYLNLVWDGLYISTDGGKTWSKQSSSNLPNSAHHGQLAANRNVQNDLWFVDGWEGAGGHGVWHSTNGGQSFGQISGFDFAITLALGKGSGNSGDQPYSVYVYGRRTGDANWGVFRSNDGGATWTRVSYYPAGLFDHPTSMAASWDTYGLVIIGLEGNSFVYSAPSGGSSGGSSAYNGPHAIPGTLQAEDYDTGGEGAGYHDADGGNSGGAYRSDNVDVESATEGGYDVGWTNAGEWLKYTVNVSAAGTYTVACRVSSGASGGSFHIENASGTNLTGAITVPATGGWQTWTTVNASLTLPAGTQTLKLVEDTGGYNLNFLTFSAQTSADTADYTFESGDQGWNNTTNATTSVTTAQRYAGAQSLAINGSVSAADRFWVRVLNAGSSTPMPGAGQTVTYHVYVPSGAPITGVQLYAQDGGWGWSEADPTVTAGQWNTVTMTIPSTAATPLNAFGINFATSGAWSGTCYIDSITVNDPSPTNLTAN